MAKFTGNNNKHVQILHLYTESHCDFMVNKVIISKQSLILQKSFRWVRNNHKFMENKCNFTEI
jgi:hypothetical protein